MYPILLSLGPIKIYSFGLFLVLATIVGSFVVWREGRALGLDEEKLVDFLLVEIFFGLIGARIYYILLYFKDFSSEPFRWLLIFHYPGLAFVGGFLGGLVGLLYFVRKERWSFWQIADFSVLGLSLAESIGRLGAFFSGTAYGTITNLPWSVTMVGLSGRRHPVQIYEALAALVTFLILLKLKSFSAKRNLPTGLIFTAYLFFWGISRLTLEIFRGDSVYFSGWRITQIVSLVFILSFFALLYWRLGRSPKVDLISFFRRFRPSGKQNQELKEQNEI